MTNWVQLESSIYWTLFVASFLLFAVWETIRPHRQASQPTGRRWGIHAALLLTGTGAGALILRSSPVLAALAFASSPWGVLNRDWMPLPVRFLAALLLLDLWNYASHTLFHRVPWLWRLHQIHHSDPDYDVSTGARFHPLELVLTRAVQLGAIAILAPPPAAVLAAEFLACVINFFAHANFSLPGFAEPTVRACLFTPDLHRIHHSIRIREQGKNLGQAFPWWDRLFGTYQAEPEGGKDRLLTGLEGEQNRPVGLGTTLAQPFRASVSPDA